MGCLAIQQHLQPCSFVDCRSGRYSPLRGLAYRLGVINGKKMLRIVRFKGSVLHMAESRDVFLATRRCRQCATPPPIALASALSRWRGTTLLAKRPGHRNGLQYASGV